VVKTVKMDGRNENGGEGWRKRTGIKENGQ